jgi:hypothetical protein
VSWESSETVSRFDGNGVPAEIASAVAAWEALGAATSSAEA